MLIPNKKPSYITSIFVWISQGTNIIFFSGYPDEMFSARCYRERSNPVWEFRRKLLDKLFFYQVEHCKQCFEWEEARVDLPGDYNDGT